VNDMILSRIYCIATVGNGNRRVVQARMLKHSDGVCGKAAKFVDTWAEKLGTNLLNTTIEEGVR